MAKIIYAISDSLGETAESVARATASQYDKETIDIVRVPYINDELQIDEVVKEAAAGGHVICHTIVSPDLRAYLDMACKEQGVQAVDIMGPVMNAVGTMTETEPRLAPEVPLPEELFQIPGRKIVGLIIDPFKLNNIREERLRTMGLHADANYANVSRIEEELNYAKTVMRRLHCPVLDVTNKSIEETAGMVMQIIQKNRVMETR